jgi:hypothetical protein
VSDGVRRQRKTAPRRPRVKIAAQFLLGPCVRAGVAESDTDWWQEQHVWCQGAELLRPGVAVTCTCPCHTDEDSPEAHARRAAEELARDRLADEAAADGQQVWAALREGGADGPG